MIRYSLQKKTVIEQKECAADVVENEQRWPDVAKNSLNDEVDQGVEVELGENFGPISGIQNNVTDRALDDLRYMGFQLRESNSKYVEPNNNIGKSSWELAVDKLNEKNGNERMSQNRQSFVKMKKERAIRRERKKAKSQEVSDLSGRSLSDSDLLARWESATKEARKAMELGKKVGIQFVGDERQVIHDIALLENSSY
ncbi:hypothetical protein V6N12_000242 [Hibiscus sabdariffa]|uniref:Uncharacterized protein n=1 Tax=Hibiscus sabdariffa TaxID=183260 RepID=A0ABR2ATC5_9ROSI